MLIATVTWLMILALIGTDLLINLLVKVGAKGADRHLEER
jgi:hypothetical protein